MVLPVTTRLLILAGILLPVSTQADVALPRIFSDHMVLQRDGTVPIWGTAAPGEAVTVTAGKAHGSATAGSDGKWMIRLAGLPVSTTPMDVTVAGKNTITFHDVLVGDVWICSGQSNMEFGEGMEESSKAELLQADHPQIRFFFVPKGPSRTPVDEMGANPPKKPLEGSWQVCSADSLINDADWGGFSAVGYNFGKEINAATYAPVGLISNCWGGQSAQSYTSLEALQANPIFKGYVGKALNVRDHFDAIYASYQAALPLYPALLAKWKLDNKAALDAYAQWQQEAKVAAANKQPVPPPPPSLRPPLAPIDPAKIPSFPTVLYNGMVHPLIPYAIKGVIWYQGEANQGGPVEYRTLLPTMIQDWRARWGEGDFPFLIVQLANYMKRLPDPSQSNWAALREAQAKTLSLPKTGLAVTIDIGEANGIHPGDKVDVAHRLAVAALNVAYGQSNIGSGPIYKSMSVEGDKIRLTFDDVGQGLVTSVPPPHFHRGEVHTIDPNLEGFAIAGADQKFVWAKAVLDGDKIVVSSPSVPHPVAVRYAWADNPLSNLYNKDGLPAVPFRTDDWPVGEQLYMHPPALAAQPK